VATGYSGNLEFMDERNSYLVGHDLVPIPVGCDPYPAGSVWAEPDLDEAAELMRRVVDDPAGARAVAEQGQRDIRRFHSPKARAPLVAARLAAARAARADRAGRADRARVPALARVARRGVHALRRRSRPPLGGGAARPRG
jgi:hypothetical protein